jgi:hypothetical protein
MQDLTPHAAHIVTNAVLAAHGIDKEIKPQLMYGLASKGTIASNRDEWIAAGGRKSGFKVTFNGDAFEEWLRQYIKGGAKKVTKTNVDDLVEQFMTSETVEA